MRHEIPLVALVLFLTLAGTSAARAGKAGEVRVHAFDLLNEGVSAYTRGDFNLAIAKLEECSRIALSSFRAQYYLGQAYIGARRYHEALDALAVALDLEPEDPQAIVAKGDAHLKLGEVEESLAAYTQALKLRPAFAPALDGMARGYESRSDDTRAIDYYRQAIASNPGYAPAYTHLGDLYLRQERFKEAVHLLEEAIAIRADYAPGLNRLGLAYAKLGLSNEAVATVQRAAEIEPGNPAHPLTLGWLQLEQGFLKRAETSFRAALDLGLPAARGGLAEIARRRGEHADALLLIDQALADASLDPLAVRQLRAQREQVASEQTALARLEARVGSAEAAPEEYAELALIETRRGQWDRAIELQSKGPTSPEHRDQLAYMLFQAGRYREAAGVYAELAAGQGGATARINHGVTLARLGDAAAAAQAYEAVLQTEPQNGLARLYLGNALLRLGDRKAAAQAYLRVLEEGRDDETAERLRRILKQIAPELLPREAEPQAPAQPAPPPFPLPPELPEPAKP